MRPSKKPGRRRSPALESPPDMADKLANIPPKGAELNTLQRNIGTRQNDKSLICTNTGLRQIRRDKASLFVSVWVDRRFRI
jgi:hypothetical protein